MIKPIGRLSTSWWRGFACRPSAAGLLLLARHGRLLYLSSRNGAVPARGDDARGNLEARPFRFGSLHEPGPAHGLDRKRQARGFFSHPRRSDQESESHQDHQHGRQGWHHLLPQRGVSEIRHSTICAAAEGHAQITDAAADALRDLVARSLERVKELRRAGDLAVLLAAANAAADEIEQRVGERLDDAERQALTAVRRFTFNAAADCWPGWSVPDKPPEN